MFGQDRPEIRLLDLGGHEKPGALDFQGSRVFVVSGDFHPGRPAAGKLECFFHSERIFGFDFAGFERPGNSGRSDGKPGIGAGFRLHPAGGSGLDIFPGQENVGVTGQGDLNRPGQGQISGRFLSLRHRKRGRKNEDRKKQRGLPASISMMRFYDS